MQTKLTLKELIEKAVAARDAAGPVATADKLLLFGRVIDALQMFSEKEHTLRETVITVRMLTRRLGSEIRAIEMAVDPKNGPTVEQIQQFYRASSELSVSLAKLERLCQTITDDKAGA